MSRSRDSIARVFREDDDFLIAAHHNPDGDALGATAALAHLLRFLGKNALQCERRAGGSGMA